MNMAGKIFTCFTISLVLIQSFNALPEAGNTNPVYYQSDPVYWRPQNVKNNDQVIIVEPTITYTRHAEYQGQPTSSSSFKSSITEKESDFKPYYGRSDDQVSYYPYYIRSTSSSTDGGNRGFDASDTAYQRFVPRNQESGSGSGGGGGGSGGGGGGGTVSSSSSGGGGEAEKKYYYSYSETRPSPPQHQQTIQQSHSPPQAEGSVSSKSSVRFYFPNGTEIRTFYNSENNQIMELHPNQYIIKVAEVPTTTTTPKPPTTTQPPIYWRTDIDCPPFTPCNTVVYQQTAQCCKCYLVPNRCCSCNYNNQHNRK